MSGANPTYLLLQAMLSLAVVIALIYLTWWGLRYLSRRQPSSRTQGPVRVLQTVYLGTDRWLYLIAVDRRRLLVGGGTSGVALLADLGETEETGDDPR